MAELKLKVTAEYDSAIKCREELKKVEEQMKSLNENSSPQEIERLIKRHAELTAQWQNSISFIGKTGVYLRDIIGKVAKTAREAVDDTQSLGSTTREITSEAERRLKTEEKIRDAIKEQRAAAVEELNKNIIRHNAKVDEDTALRQALDQKYNGKGTSFYSEEDQQRLRALNDEMEQTRISVENGNTQIEVFDTLMEESTQRTEKLKTTIDEMGNVYKGFADTAAGSGPKIFISEEVYNRYNELSEKIKSIKEEIKAMPEGDYDVDTLKRLQAELTDAQTEFRALDESASHAAEILGAKLGGQVADATKRLYDMNRTVRLYQLAWDNANNALMKAKEELANAQSPAAIKKAQEEVDRLQVKLDDATQELMKFKSLQKDAMNEVQLLERKVDGEGEEGADITTAVAGQMKGMLRTIASFSGIGMGLGQLKDFFSQAKHWREYFQDIESSMSTFLGSAEKGTEFTEKLKAHAYYNMFEFSDLAAASQQMISYGHNVDDIIPRLEQLSNVATGTHGSLMEIVDAYNRAKATGVVDARGVQSWAVKGVMIRDELRKMGETATSSTITFEQLNKVLDKVTGEGGRFHNLMMNMMDNVSSEQGQLQDTLATMFSEIGKKYEGVFVKFLKLQSAIAENYDGIAGGLIDWGADMANGVMEGLLENWQSIVKVIKDAVIAYGAYRTALIATTAFQKAKNKWDDAAIAAQKLNNMEVDKAALAKARESAAEVTNTAAKKTNTVTTGQQTGMIALNTTATNANTVAKGKNTAASVLLSKAIRALTNPYVLATAAIASIAYACYAAYDGMLTQKEAQKLLSDASEDFNTKMDEQKQKDLNNISIIQSKTASLVEQTKAYQQLIKERAIFNGYTKEEIANMSPEQIERLEKEDTERQNEERLRNQVKAAEEMVDRLRGLAFASIGEDDVIDEIIKSNNLPEEYANSIKDQIGALTDLPSFSKKLLQESQSALQEYLSGEAEAGVVEGVSKGIKNPQLQASLIGALQGFAKSVTETENSVAQQKAEIEQQIKDEEGKWFGTGETDAKELRKQLVSLDDTLQNVRKSNGQAFGERVQKAIEDSEKKVSDLEEKIAKATGEKKIQLTTEWNAAKDEQEVLRSILKFFEAGQGTDKEFVIKIVRSMENNIIGDENLIDIGDDYKMIDDLAQDVISRTNEAKDTFMQLKVKSVDNAKEIMESYGLTAEGIDSKFEKATAKVQKDINDIQQKIIEAQKESKDTGQLTLTLKRKEQELDYINKIKRDLKELTSNPWNMVLNISAFIPETLKKFFKKVTGLDLDESQRAQQEGKEAGDNKTTEEEPHSGKYFYQQRQADKRAKAKQYQDLINGRGVYNGKDYSRLTAKEFDDEMQALSQYANVVKKGDEAAKKAAARKAKIIADELKFQEKMRDLQLQADRAREDALIAQIDSDSERERRQREEQHKRAIQDVQKQTDELYKEIYQQRKTDYDTANSEKGLKYENTDAGKEGYLTPKAQKDIYDSLTEKEKQLYDVRMKIIIDGMAKTNAEWTTTLQARARTEEQATRDFLKTWGDYEQKKLAITESYEQKIRDAATPTEAAGYQLQMDKELDKLNSDELMKGIDWNGVFNDLKGHTEEYLIGLRDQLQGLLDSGQITDVEQMNTIYGKIREINDAIADENGLFNSVNEAQREHNRLLQQSADAQKVLNEARRQEFDIESEVHGILQSIADLTEGTDLEGVDVDDNDSVWMELFPKDSPEYNQMVELLQKLRVAEGNLAAARNKTASATAKATQAEDATEEDWKDKLARVTGNINDWTQKNLGQLPDLLKEVGLGSAGEKVSQGLSAVGNVAGAAADYASGNYVGAALKAVMAVKDFGRVLGIGGGNAKEVAETTERLTKSNEYLAERINDLSEVMAKQTGAQALHTYEEALKAQEQLQKQNMEILQAQMGYSAKHHSNAHYADDNKIRGFNADAQYAFRAAGVEISTITGLKSIYNLTPEQLKAIKDFAPDLWNYITTVGKYDKSEYWENVVKQAGKTAELSEQIKQTLTTTTEDDVFSDFLNSLYELADGSETVFDDIADNWQKMVNKMVINNFIGSQYQDELKKWFDELSKVNERRLKGGSIYDYKKDIKDLQLWKEDIIRRGQEDLEFYRDMGLVQSSGSEPSAQAKSLSNISYDQADTLVGIAFAMQIALEQSRGELSILNATTEKINAVSSEYRDIAADSRDILAGMAIHVEEIRDGVVDTIVPRIKNIDDEIVKVRKVVEAQ